MDNKADTLAFAREFAAAGTDLYDLLGVDTSTPRDDIHRAWRRKGLRYHPDKAGDRYDPALYERFVHARDVLVDEAARAAYDTARAAAAQRRLETEQMSAERRRFKDELEAAEREAAAAAAAGGGGGAGGGGAPFAFHGSTTAADSAEREKLREAGRRRAEERLRRAQEAQDRVRQQEEARADAREAALEQRLREKEDKARRRAERRRGATGTPQQRRDEGDASSRRKDQGDAADPVWRTLLGKRPDSSSTADAEPIQTRPLYAYTLERLRAAGAAQRQRHQEQQQQQQQPGEAPGPLPPFEPQWDAVQDPAVRQFIKRVPRLGSKKASGTVPMDTT